MATHFVNLDALIRREDFDIEVVPRKAAPFDGAYKLKISELENDSLMYKMLRKPDFQRTTAHWTPTKIAGFIESFLSGDLIPSVILWQSEASGSIFVIDGAHRLSALAAWVHDDFGDRNISIPFFDGNIPPEQKRLADETRKLIGQSVGSYADIKFAANPSPERARYQGNIAAGGVTLQWVRGDASRAERSFHTINTEQTPIGDLEVRLIRDRRCPNAIATRALIGAGTGQYCRTTFSEENKTHIKTLAKEIYDDLFIPPLETPIKTLDLPVAGRSYSADSIKMILDLVEFLNKQPPAPSEQKKARRKPKPDILAPTMVEDEDGTATANFLKNVRRASSRIAGNRPASLGLHPAVYFYSATGAYQPSAFLAAISFVQDLEARDRLMVFVEHRFVFEELLLKWKSFINFIVKQYGSGNRSLTVLIKLYHYLFNGVVEHMSDEQILPTLLADPRLAFIRSKIDPDTGVSRAFNSERKSAIFLRQAIDSATTCNICRARVHARSFTVDHKQRKADGGLGSEDNGQITHPFCNSGFKEHAISQTSEMFVHVEENSDRTVEPEEEPFS